MAGMPSVDVKVEFGNCPLLCQVAEQLAAKLADGRECDLLRGPLLAVAAADGGPAHVVGVGDVWIDGVCYRQVQFELPPDFLSCGVDAFVAGYDPLGARGVCSRDLRPMAELVEIDQAEAPGMTASEHRALLDRLRGKMYVAPSWHLSWPGPIGFGELDQQEPAEVEGDRLMRLIRQAAGG